MERKTLFITLAPTTAVVAGLASVAPGTAQADIIWSLGDRFTIAFTEGDNDPTNQRASALIGNFTTTDDGIIKVDYNITTSGSAIFCETFFVDQHGNTFCTAPHRNSVWNSSLPNNSVINKGDSFFVLVSEPPDNTLERDQLTMEFTGSLTGRVNPDPVLLVDETVTLLTPEGGVAAFYHRSGDVGAVSVAPEPSTASVLGAGLLGLASLWRRRRQILGLVQ